MLEKCLISRGRRSGPTSATSKSFEPPGMERRCVLQAIAVRTSEAGLGEHLACRDKWTAFVPSLVVCRDTSLQRSQCRACARAKQELYSLNVRKTPVPEYGRRRTGTLKQTTGSMPLDSQVCERSPFSFGRSMLAQLWSSHEPGRDLARPGRPPDNTNYSCRSTVLGRFMRVRWVRFLLRHAAIYPKA